MQGVYEIFIIKIFENQSMLENGFLKSARPIFRK